MTRERERENVLDVFRAWAIILVVASHTQILLQGGLGNDIFFGLSGFLAAMPFTPDCEQKFSSIFSAPKYWLAKIFRIIPLFWFILIAVYLLNLQNFTISLHSSKDTNLLNNLFFINNRGHLWFLQQQMLMYFCVPFIFFTLIFIKNFLIHRTYKKYKNIIYAILLLISSLYLHNNLTSSIFYLKANGGHQSFRIGLFMTGMSFAFFYKFIKDLNFNTNKLPSRTSNFVIILFILFTIVSSYPVLKFIIPSMPKFFIGWKYPMSCTIITLISITICLIQPLSGTTKKILENNFTACIAKVSFGAYLIHWYFIGVFKPLGSPNHFTMVFITSIIFSYILHIFIEKPFIIFSKTHDTKQLKNFYINLVFSKN